MPHTFAPRCAAGQTELAARVPAYPKAKSEAPWHGTRASTVSLKLCEGSLEPWPAALWVVGDPKRGKRGRIRSGPNGALLGEAEEIGLHIIRLAAHRRVVRLHAGCFALRRDFFSRCRLASQ